MKVELSGYNIDNLLKTLYSKKVTLKNVFREDYNKISFEILDKDFKKVKRYIANFKVKTSLCGIRKLPYMMLENIGAIIGFFVGVVFSIFVVYDT